jgi:hypothetical protein
MSQTLGPVVPGTFRAPRVQVLINGTAMQGVESVSVDLTNQFEAACWTLQANIEPSYAMNAAFWGQQTNVMAKIQIGFDPGNGVIPWQTVLVGVVDQYVLDLDSRSISLSGRDLASLLIDTKTANTYSNFTASEIVTMICQSLGNNPDGTPVLTPVATPTKTIVGTYYQIDTSTSGLGAFHQSITEWDLLIYLAQQEGFDLFVQGSSLFFQPVATAAATPYAISWQLGQDNIPVSNVIGLQLTHSLTLAKGITVTIKSYNSSLGRTITAKTADPHFDAANTGTQDYVFYVPNLTPEGAQALANQRYADISRHLKTINFEAPGDTVLSPRGVIALSGTGTVFDTNYYPDAIHLELSQPGGFTMRVTAKNIPPTPSAIIPTLGNADGSSAGDGL